jgi:hypothetical protein
VVRLEAVNHTPIKLDRSPLTLASDAPSTGHSLLDVLMPIIGADFLHHFSLLVDIKQILWVFVFKMG